MQENDKQHDTCQTSIVLAYADQTLPTKQAGETSDRAGEHQQAKMHQADASVQP
jgi:hypothetical protein